jgi:hypothetical protein
MIPNALTPIGAVLQLIWSSSAFAADALHAPGGGAVRATLAADPNARVGTAGLYTTP